MFGLQNILNMAGFLFAAPMGFNNYQFFISIIEMKNPPMHSHHFRFMFIHYLLMQIYAAKHCGPVRGGHLVKDVCFHIKAC